MGGWGVALFCVCACTSAQCVLPLIKCLPDRNVVLYWVHVENNTTQKLFLTCTLRSIRSHSEEKDREEARKLVRRVISPITICFLSHKTKVLSVLCSMGLSLYCAVIQYISPSDCGATVAQYTSLKHIMGKNGNASFGSI